MISGRAVQQSIRERAVSIGLPKATLEADLNVPPHAQGIVLFAHGSGSSRRSPRNRFVAEALQTHGIATLLADLLTANEELIDQRTTQLRFNIHLLSKRVAGATAWMQRQSELRGLRIGYFGASTGSAAALVAASQLAGAIGAIVSRGGRPDLADGALGSVTAPTLLIVGGNDPAVLELNQQALSDLGSKEKRLVVVPGATHLFEEPGALEEVATLAAEWFGLHLVNAGPAKVDAHRQ